MKIRIKETTKEVEVTNNSIKIHQIEKETVISVEEEYVHHVNYLKNLGYKTIPEDWE